MSQMHHRDDDYLPCSYYGEYMPNDKGFAYFMEAGKFYFALLDSSGGVILRSEGYSSEHSRDTGVVSVEKNMHEDGNYIIKSNPDGKFVLCLRAANHVEIARSCAYDTEKEAMSLLPSVREKAQVKTSKPSTPDDDYLICREYKERIDQTAIDNPEFIAFHHENGKYYFAWVEDKQVLMRSEGYSSQAARDKGIESVKRNWDIEEHFSVEEYHGAYFGILKGGNKQEIARSCPVNSDEEARQSFPSERNKRQASLQKKSARQQEDYLTCSEYQLHMQDISAIHVDFIGFHNEDGRHFFAWIQDGQVLMRSEGYTSNTARDKGIESVLQNRDIEDRFVVEELEGLFYTVLKAGNHIEIARSCPFASEEDARVIFPSHREKNIQTATLSDIIYEKLEDNYLPCRDYESQISQRSLKFSDFITFHHENGQHYFAWVSDDDKIILRGEGYSSTEARDRGIESVISNRKSEERFKIEEIRGFQFLMLTSGNHKEIARSCPKVDVQAAMELMDSVVVSTADESVVSNVDAIPLPFSTHTPLSFPDLNDSSQNREPAVSLADKKSDEVSVSEGFNWWWLLLLLLIPLVWSIYRGCNA